MKKFLVAIAMFVGFSANAEQVGRAKHITLVKPGQRQSKQHKTNDLFKSYLELSSFRHRVLSQNLANLNTPGYKADEVSMPKGFEDLNGKGKSSPKVRMLITSDKHIMGKRGREGKFTSHKLKDPDEVKKNGNNVSLRQQMTKLSQNKNDYSAAVKAYATTNSLFSSVLGK